MPYVTSVCDQDWMMDVCSGDYCRQGKICWVNICGFSAIKSFHKYFCCLGHKCSLFSKFKRCTYIHGKTFAVLLKLWKTPKFSPVNLSRLLYIVWMLLLLKHQSILCMPLSNLGKVTDICNQINDTLHRKMVWPMIWLLETTYPRATLYWVITSCPD